MGPAREYDLLVLGGGNAALCAALMAREAGLSVLLVESAPKHFRGDVADGVLVLDDEHAPPEARGLGGRGGTRPPRDGNDRPVGRAVRHARGPAGDVARSLALGTNRGDLPPDRRCRRRPPPSDPPPHRADRPR